ncbi:hypothetical protein MTO98_07660 [Mucilaginibacter sp. SMC90]|uniref:hypothetical protein n=1 Tax=Mucilaginibacter sp. SMC90 TaxID=2929803 RepID=UPI001FB4B51B|nr:hypothetical protein [Mucilaginibacter sp. SMC90]UOE50951.1 hypothetical protein MTO98_07660 [Mucilaginibacter sp. SMC90]
MSGISPWAAAVKQFFHGQDLPALYTREMAGYTFRVHRLGNSLWIAVTCPKGMQVILNQQ